MKFGHLGFLFFLVALKSASASELVDLPRGCYVQQKYPCSISFEQSRLEFKKGDSVFSLKKGSVLEFTGPQEIHLLKGQLWLRNADQMKLKISAIFDLQVSGDWFFEVQSVDRVLMRNLKGSIQFLSEFVFKNEALPVGFENWYSRVTTVGQIQRGLIRPIEDRFFEEWKPLSGMSFAEARKLFREYQSGWVLAVEESSKFYQEVARRGIAAVEAQQRSQQERRQKIHDEQQKIRQMNRQRLGLDQVGSD